MTCGWWTSPLQDKPSTGNISTLVQLLLKGLRATQAEFKSVCVWQGTTSTGKASGCKLARQIQAPKPSQKTYLREGQRLHTHSLIEPRQHPCKLAIITPILQNGRLRLSRIQWLAQMSRLRGHMNRTATRHCPSMASPMQQPYVLYKLCIIYGGSTF